MSHSPGPWWTLDHDLGYDIHNRFGWIADLRFRESDISSDHKGVSADARLIAAAPDLLRELKSALLYIETYGGEVTASFAAGGNLDEVKRLIDRVEND